MRRKWEVSEKGGSEPWERPCSHEEMTFVASSDALLSSQEKTAKVAAAR
jgi:hypothetical protein